jgi:GH18 family chitinase
MALTKPSDRLLGVLERSIILPSHIAGWSPPYVNMHILQCNDNLWPCEVDVLTHINLAFASIDVSAFTIIPMDDSMTTDVFQNFANIKSLRPNIQAFVSVGGWSFSDNNTKTQPLLGEIAASAANRELFANNVVAFLNQYGLDGIDIDWYVTATSSITSKRLGHLTEVNAREYPGAPDRGGKERDVQNYVLLLQSLRAAFNSQTRPLGLTFTAPSSVRSSVRVYCVCTGCWHMMSTGTFDGLTYRV